MKIGILSQVCSKHDMEFFKRSAENKGIDFKVLNPSELIISIKKDRPVLLDMNHKPVNLSGIINWEPYPVFEELEQVCISLGISFLNSVDAVRTARNKMLTSLLLSRSNLPQPDTFFTTGADLSFARHEIPLVIKPKTGTQGRGAVKVNSSAELDRIAGAKFSRSGFYLQSFVPNDGWDIRVLVVGDKVLGAIKKTAAQGEWRTHVIYGGTTAPFAVNRELEQLSLSAVKALGLSFAGVDVIVDNRDGGYKILEANAVPGLKIFEKTTGTSIADAVLDLITGEVHKQ